jgi:hypothetical protein
MTSSTPSAPSRKPKSFLASLFDFKFEEWVTLKVAGFLYAVVLIGVLISAVISVITLLNQGGFSWLVALVGVPIGTLVVILVVRLVFESTVATIAVAKNTEGLNRRD